MIPPSNLWQDLTTTDFDHLDAERTVALVPLGAIEQHGPHLPVATDAVIAESLARRAAAMASAAVPVLVLPTQAVGKSNEHIAFPGTLTIEPATLLAHWLALGQSIARAGVRKLLFLNAHGGQPQIMEIVARELRVSERMFAVSSSWWQMGYPDVGIADSEIRHGIHGGQIETSVMLALRPDLVRMHLAQNFVPVLPEIETRYEKLRLLGGISAGWQAQDLHPLGVAGAADLATAELGEAIVEHAVTGLATLIREVSHYPLSNLTDRQASAQSIPEELRTGPEPP